MDLLLKKEVRCAWNKPLFLEVLQHLPVGLSTTPTQSYSRLGPRMNQSTACIRGKSQDRTVAAQFVEGLVYSGKSLCLKPKMKSPFSHSLRLCSCLILCLFVHLLRPGLE